MDNESIELFLRKYYKSTYWIEDESAEINFIQTTSNQGEFWLEPPDTFNVARPERFGEYILNPAAQDLDFDNLNYFVPSEEEFETGVYGYIGEQTARKYSDQYILPGIEVWKYLEENPDSCPEVMSDGNHYFLFGSVLRDTDGLWGVTHIRWDDGQWDVDCSFLAQYWYEPCRVLLISKQ